MWWFACGGAALLGLLGGGATSPPGSVAALTISVGALGALTGTCCRLSSESLPEDLGRAIARSAVIGAVAILGIVLPFLVLGRAWFVGVFLLGVTSPPSVKWCRSRWHAPTPPGGLSGVETELWTTWAMSGQALRHPMSAADAAVLLDVRQQVLDELVARYGGIPGQLWPDGQAPPESGARRRT